ncbi:hypothetical protein [Paenibacillus sp. BK720]|uniref:hypothetical protein n=1 Tax=Paenibacillus sp. BK720 TaxID=2587092 RepID=UPI0014245BF2|nr:hypothetical protein [Paenibacillus sp. BK720]NIK69678.1 hypothetical protein [Paenibacillus sp. BK720]
MGHRANLLIVKGDSYELYYSHWNAITMPEDLFWGARHARKFIKKQVAVDNSEWLDEVWAEGGVVFDKKQKKLVFYGGEDLRYGIPLRRLFLKLMEKVWDGWEIQWAFNGIMDLAAYVGYPKEKIVSSTPVNGMDGKTDSRLSEPLEEKSWADTLVSVTFSQDEMLIFPVYGQTEPLFIGPDLINSINKDVGYEHLQFSEWSDHFPSAGYHIDIPGKRLELWHADDVPNLLERLRKIWLGWEIIDHYDYYESQILRTNGRLQFKDVNQQELLSDLQTLLLRESGSAFASLQNVVHAIAGTGKEAKVNPFALRFNPLELTRRKKEKILARAIAKL